MVPAILRPCLLPPSLGIIPNLELHPSPQDRRERLLQLTPAGMDHAQPLVQRARAFGQAVFQTFGQDRTARLLAEMDALSTVMERTIAQEDTPGERS